MLVVATIILGVVAVIVFVTMQNPWVEMDIYQLYELKIANPGTKDGYKNVGNFECAGDILKDFSIERSKIKDQFGLEGKVTCNDLINKYIQR